MNHGAVRATMLLRRSSLRYQAQRLAIPSREPFPAFNRHLRFLKSNKILSLTNKPPAFDPHSRLPQIFRRPVATKAPASHHGPVYRFLYRFFAYTGGFILVSGGLVLAFFIYDASTYREDLTFSDISVSEHALSPKRGGPKNLPIADVLVDDDEHAENSKRKNKPKLVILGSGWGSVALLKTLNPDDYHVTVVSPVNYFLFTPMLPSATVGTLELRSLVEPVRRIVQRAKGHFLKAEAVDVELSERLLEVAQTDADGERCHFYLPYDKLVLGVGKSSSTTLVNIRLWRLTVRQALQQIHTVLKVSNIVIF